MTKRLVFNIWRGIFLDTILNREEVDKRRDVLMRREVWNRFIHTLYTAGVITSAQYDSWETPTGVDSVTA